jgi:predicted Fe-Mo cluster-binding NifX family protein
VFKKKNQAGLQRFRGMPGLRSLLSNNKEFRIMKICMPVVSNSGIESAINPHFGSTPTFLIIDDQNCEITEIRNDNQHHMHGMCQPLAVLAGHSFDAIVVGGIGLGALSKLKAAGFRVFRSEFPDVRQTMDAIKAGTLPEVDMESACRGHNCH